MLPPELKKCFECIEEKLRTVNDISGKLDNLEKLVFELHNSIRGMLSLIKFYIFKVFFKKNTYKIVNSI